MHRASAHWRPGGPRADPHGSALVLQPVDLLVLICNSETYGAVQAFVLTYLFGNTAHEQSTPIFRDQESLRKMNSFAEAIVMSCW